MTQTRSFGYLYAHRSSSGRSYGISHSDRSTQTQRKPRIILFALSIVDLNLGRNWFVREWRKSKCVTSFSGRVVQSLRVVRDPLIPNEDGASLVPHPTLEVLTFRNVVEEEAKKIIRLFAIESHNVLGVDRVHVQGFLLRDWVHDDNRVFLPQLGSSHHRAVAVLHLLRDTVVVGVHCGQAFESLPEPGRERIESLHT